MAGEGWQRRHIEAPPVIRFVISSVSKERLQVILEQQLACARINALSNKQRYDLQRP
jgi:hypothetical protein